MPWFAEELKHFFDETEHAINCVNKRVKKGSKRLSYAREIAVDNACLLLKKYSTKKLTLYQGHKLARVLLGNEQADLYKYLKRLRLRTSPEHE